MMRTILVGILVLMAAGVGYLTWDWYSRQFSGEAYGSEFALVDHTGEEITRDAFMGHPTAVFFGFTHCPEICPTTLFELDGWLKQLGSEGEDVRAYFVTVDPERDTPEVLDSYVSNVSDRITGITGGKEEVEAMLKGYNIYWKKVPLDDGGYTMDHTASVILLGPDGSFFGTIAYGENPDTALSKLKRLAGG
ncbi:MAG: SCO family protein [Rhizobiaceae bacterium]|nr:SCO family protein [Rhizobiaceae bacterium]MCV0406583.1 SCO family protein [Rhizobiaceae bacterium]